MLFFLLASLFLLPLFYLPFFTFSEFSKVMLVVFFGVILSFLLGCFFWSKAKIKLPAKNIFISLIIFWGAYLLSTVFSINRITSVVGIYPLLTGGLIFYFLLIVYFFISLLKAGKKLLFQTLFLTGLTVSLIGLGQYFSNLINTHNVFFRVFATIGQPNRMAFFLLPVIPLGFSLYENEKVSRNKTIYFVGLTLTLLAFLLTFSRTAFFSFFLTFCLYIFIKTRNKFLPLSKNILILLSGSFFIGIIFLFQGLPGALNFKPNSSLTLRLAEWQGIRNVIINRSWEKQLVGSGPDTSYYTFFKYRPEIYNNSLEEKSAGPLQVRNFYLNLLNTTGILGLGAYLFFLCQLLNLSFRQIKQDRLSSGIFFSLVSISVYSLFYYQTETVLVIFWCLTGLVAASTTKKYILPDKIAKAGAIILFLFTLLAVFLLPKIIVADYLATPPTSSKSLSDASKSNPFFDIYSRTLANYYMAEMLDLKDKDKNLALEKYRLAKQAADSALLLAPEDVRNIRQLVFINYYAGVNLDKIYQKENISAAKRLVNLSPTDANNWDQLGLVYLDFGDLDNAKLSFEKVKFLKPDSQSAPLHLDEVAKQKGEKPNTDSP